MLVAPPTTARVDAITIRVMACSRPKFSGRDFVQLYITGIAERAAIALAVSRSALASSGLLASTHTTRHAAADSAARSAASPLPKLFAAQKQILWPALVQYLLTAHNRLSDTFRRSYLQVTALVLLAALLLLVLVILVWIIHRLFLVVDFSLLRTTSGRGLVSFDTVRRTSANVY
jgi:hypothetical protein